VKKETNLAILLRQEESKRQKKGGNGADLMRTKSKNGEKKIFATSCKIGDVPRLAWGRKGKGRRDEKI